MRKSVMCSAVLVLLAAATLSGTLKAETAAGEPTLLQAAVGAGRFNTLIAAVKVAGLIETFAGDGPLTLFAPTDAAFARLPSGTIESLLRPENKPKLIALLKNHAVAGSYRADQLLPSIALKTLQGQDLAIERDGKVVRINGAQFVAGETTCRNGILHGIDAVILPKPSDGAANRSGLKK